MKVSRRFFLNVAICVTVLTGCNTTPLKGALIGNNISNAQTYTIVLPTGKGNSRSPLEFVEFTPTHSITSFDNSNRASHVRTQLAFISEDLAELKVCNGETYMSGEVFESCSIITATVNVTKSASAVTISMTPLFKASEQAYGKDFSAITPPRIHVEDFYYHASHHSISRLTAQNDRSFDLIVRGYSSIDEAEHDLGSIYQPLNSPFNMRSSSRRGAASKQHYKFRSAQLEANVYVTTEENNGNTISGLQIGGRSHPKVRTTTNWLDVYTDVISQLQKPI